MNKTIQTKLFTALILALALVPQGCNKEGDTNQPPHAPSNPYPKNGWLNTPIEMDFSWQCADPDKDRITYNIFLGKTDPPPLVASQVKDGMYEVTGLESNTQYYWTVEAVDEHSEATTGNVWKFKTVDTSLHYGQPCPETPTVEYMGQTYHTVMIGSQCWMKENLNYETGNSECNNNDPSNCEAYGRVYEWKAVMNGEPSSNSVPSGIRGICPPGWHVPSDNEWKILLGTVDSYYGVGHTEWDEINWNDTRQGFDAGRNLKSSSGWEDQGNGTDLFGFSALSGGASFWSSTQTTLEEETYWYVSLSGAYDEVLHIWIPGSYGRSLRCLKD